MNATAPTPVARPPSTLKRDLVWLIALVLAFLLGYLIALLMRPPLTAPVCPSTTSTSPSAGGAGGGGSGGGGGGKPGAPGSPVQLGAKGGGNGSVVGAGGTVNGGGAPTKVGGGGSGNGDLSGGGNVSASGSTVSDGGDAKLAGSGGDADLSSGGGGKLKLPTDPDRTATDADKAKPIAGNGAVPPGGEAGDEALDDMPDMKLPPGQPGSRMLAARDFRYDRSNLPHYAGGVDKIASAMAIPPGGTVADGNTTVAEIVTNDAPEAVAAWYRTQLPQDKWQMQAAPSAAEVDQNIAQTDKPAADFDQLAKDMEKTQQPGGGGQAAAMAILMKGMMAGQHGGANGDAGIQGTPLDSMFGKIANMQLRGAQEGLNRMREAHLTMFQPTDRAHDSRMILILRDAKTGKTAVVIMKKATQA